MSSPAAPSAARRFASRWAAGIKAAGAPAKSMTEIEGQLGVLAERLLTAARAKPFVADAAGDVGARLIAAHYRDAAVLRSTLELLDARFADEAGIDEQRLLAVRGALAEGFTRALRQEVLAEQEITQRAALAAVRSADEQRRASEARFQAVFAGAAVGIGTVDMNGVVTDVNAAMAEMLGVPESEIVGRTIAEVLRPVNIGEAYAEFMKLATGEIPRFRVDTAHVRPDGRTTHIDLTMSMVPDSNGTPDFIIGVAVDVTEPRKLADQLWYEARHDALTELPNRKLCLELLDVMHSPAGLCYLDLDGFKHINDSLGHDVGNRVLCVVANRLRAVVEPHGCTVFRLGGDEFVVLVEPCPSPVAAGRLAGLMLAAVERPIRIDEQDLSITGSIGVAHTATAGNDPHQLLRAADIAMTSAKKQDVGCWRRYDPASGALEVARYGLATALPAALSRGEFRLHYQPLVDLNGATVRGFEALARWEHPRLGAVPPDQFVPVAEETGHIISLGKWALTTACRDVRAWLDDGAAPDFYVSVNVAAAQVRQPSFASDVLATLDAAGLPAANLQLELTESDVAGDTHGALAALHELAAAGVRLAVDDFGTGYSNLATLGRLPVHQLKIDRALLASSLPGSTPDPAHDKILAATIALAHSLDLTVTAEGVETQAQADRLRLLNCDMAQGWLYGRPVPAPETARFRAPAGRASTA